VATSSSSIDRRLSRNSVVAQYSTQTRNCSPIKVFQHVSYFVLVPACSYYSLPRFSLTLSSFFLVFFRLTHLFLSLSLRFYIFLSWDTPPVFPDIASIQRVRRLLNSLRAALEKLGDVYGVAFFGLNDQTYPGRCFGTMRKTTRER